MNPKVMTPSITETKDKIVILGEKQNLDALGQLLIAKAKLGRHLSATFYDGVNKPIEIISDDDLNLT